MTPPASRVRRRSQNPGMGTLTTGIMARVRLTRNERDPAAEPVLVWIAGLIALATFVRLGAGTDAVTLAAAAAPWSMALGLTLALLLRVPAR